MTATYDGVLTVGPRAKSVGACCRAMDEAAMRGQFYISQKGALMLRRSDRPNAGQECIACPFCGARVCTAPRPVTIDTESPMYAALCEQAERGEGPLAAPEGME